MGRKPKPGNDFDALARAARSHLRRCDLLGKSLDSRMKIKLEASPEWVPDEDFRRDFAAITSTIKDAGAALTKALDANKKDLGGLTEEQLEAQFKQELINAAQTMSDEDWQRMCEARAKVVR